ncbi:MAG: hypothetical protein AAF401_15080, partial [Pseudomonadota bacterium]
AEPEPSSLVERALGPLAGLAAGGAWVRADVAQRAGRDELFYARAERALALQPSATQGWIFFAHHLVFDRASLERAPSEANAGVREHWIRAGVALLERGEATAAEPAELVFDRGLIFTYLAALEPEDRAWPPSEAEAWTLAVEQHAPAGAGEARRRLSVQVAG